MEQYPTELPCSKPTNSPQQGAWSVAPITQFRLDERARWKRRVLSLIFVGLLISVLVHLIVFLFSYSVASGDGSAPPKGATTTIEFAILEEESFTALPEGDRMTQSESNRTDARSEIIESTQATLEADSSASSLIPSTESRVTSLTGSGSSGMGVGMGGSGGGGTSFFGISSEGSRFCYIVDRSGSMDSGGRLVAAKAELISSLQKLPDFVKFYVLFYSSGLTEPSMQQGWNTARRGTIKRMADEIRTMSASGGTVPMPAFINAFALSPPPDIIFFLTDGQITGFSIEALLEIMPTNKKVVINTIAFGNSASKTLLQEIANATDGQYTFVPEGRNP
ncbi:MAG TPA: VWA domain-containing protein [Phycisphaerales bacterium]|nr:VWA domain-containing protein [Phycisphaerales bacterium]HIB49838.1 VWA domain-containing protein [Phycisphaerales bacterium]HIO19772.1 VWA domain-containing protein [Phycisphaerales bacterium]